MIYGVPRGILVEQGIQNPYAILIPSLVRGSVARGRAGMVGPGENFWPNVHVDDGMSSLGISATDNMLRSYFKQLLTCTSYYSIKFDSLQRA